MLVDIDVPVRHPSLQNLHIAVDGAESHLHAVLRQTSIEGPGDLVPPHSSDQHVAIQRYVRERLVQIARATRDSAVQVPLIKDVHFALDRKRCRDQLSEQPLLFALTNTTTERSSLGFTASRETGIVRLISQPKADSRELLSL